MKAKIPKEIDHCGACSFKTRKLNKFEAPPCTSNGYKTFYFCDLCFCTMASNSAIYPDQYKESGETMRTVCHVGNAIIAAIKSKRA